MLGRKGSAESPKGCVELFGKMGIYMKAIGVRGRRMGLELCIGKI